MVNFGEAIEAYTKGARDTIKAYGDQIVKSFVIHREPIQGILDKVINVLSGGSWSDLKKKNSYDQFYHLYALVTLDTGRVIRIEKNANITLTPGGEGGGEYEDVDLKGKSFTFAQMLDRTQQKIGDYAFFGYSPFTYPPGNCQDWLSNVLKANGIGNEGNIKFIKQDIEQLAKELPGITKRIGDAVTGLGSYVEHGIGKVKDFFGFKRGGRVKGRGAVRRVGFGNNRVHERRRW